MQITPQSIEIERIYAQVSRGDHRVVAISSANHGEGVTSIALALAQRNLLAGKATLLVDFNLYRPSLHTLLEFDVPSDNVANHDVPQLVTVAEQPLALIGITSPTSREQITRLRNPGVLEQRVSEWKEKFDLIVFDTSPINQDNASYIPAERVAAACDGYLLVVLAGKTTEAMVSSVVAKMKAVNANLIGCIFNDRDNPQLKNELLREVRRLEPRFSWFSTRIAKWIHNCHLLAMEI